MPDAVMILANRVVAVDHVNHRTTLLAVCDGDEQEADRWLDVAEREVRELLRAQASNRDAQTSSAQPMSDGPVVFHCGRGRTQYLADIARCQAALSAGESYEVCLTDQIHTDAALIHGISTACCDDATHRRSPPIEARRARDLISLARAFLSVERDRCVQARPIKGTAPRSADPAADDAARAGLLDDEKTFAEHLMIVDLLRNDLGRVCEIDSVRVPGLMVVESYATVHQLISNVTGLWKPSQPRRVRARMLPRRLDDGRTKAADDGDHRRHRA